MGERNGENRRGREGRGGTEGRGEKGFHALTAASVDVFPVPANLGLPVPSRGRGCHFCHLGGLITCAP